MFSEISSRGRYVFKVFRKSISDAKTHKSLVSLRSLMQRVVGHVCVVVTVVTVAVAMSPPVAKATAAGDDRRVNGRVLVGTGI